MAFDVNQQENENISNHHMDLDKYGVWVKKAPCIIEEEITASNTTSPVDTPLEEMPEISEPTADISPIDDFESMALKETADLPAFVEEDTTLAIQNQDEHLGIQQEDEIPLETFIDTDFLDDFTNDISALLEEKEMVPETPLAEETSVDSQEDFVVSEETMLPEELPVPEEILATQEESFAPKKESFESIEIDSDNKAAGDDLAEDVSDPFTDESALDGTEIDMELSNDFDEEKHFFMDGSISPVQDFTDAEENPVLEDKTEEFQLDNGVEEISIDEFLGDSDEISIEDFLDTPVQEKSDIQDEVPMDMNLTFDDDFAVDTAAEPGNQVEEAAAADILDDFDQMFDSIVDEAEIQAEQAAPETPAEEQKVEFQFDEVNDFDDLLEELSDPKDTENKYEPPKDFVMEVTMDDEEKQDLAVTQLDDEMETMENITLSMDDTEKTDENRNSYLDRLQISDYTETNRISEDDFDIDKIMSEVEDIGEVASETPSQAETETVEEPTPDDVCPEKSQDTTMEMSEEAMEFNQNEMEQPEGSRTEELISNIASEIALLRDEIANLKNEFEAFKGGQPVAAGIGTETEEKETSSGGFFADSTDDDTIALSGDELSNIFNTADFTEESVEAEAQQPDEDSDNGLPAMDFDSETLEEPIIDDNYFDDEETSELPDEIDVPTGIAAQEDEIFEEIELDEEEVEMELQEPESDDQLEAFDATEEQIEEFDGNVSDEFSSDEETLEEVESIPEAIQEIGSVSDFNDEIDSEEGIQKEPVEEVEPEELFEEFFLEGEFLEQEPLQEDFAQEEAVEVAEHAEESISDEPAVEAIEAAETFEEEITDEPTEAVFESSQWDTLADDTMGFSDISAGDSSNEEESQSDISSFDDDPLIIEETVDTVSVAEEELLEELEEIPVSDDDLGDLETLQQETVEEETASLEPAQDAVEAGEEPVVEAEQVVEGEPTVEAICGSDTDLEIDEPSSKEIPDDLKNDIKSVLVYMDQLLDSLPEEKIAEFARSEHFELYKKLFTELGLS